MQVLPDSLDRLDYAVAFPPGAPDALRAALSNTLLKLQAGGCCALMCCASVWLCSAAPGLMCSTRQACLHRAGAQNLCLPGKSLVECISNRTDCDHQAGSLGVYTAHNSH